MKCKVLAAFMLLLGFTGCKTNKPVASDTKMLTQSAKQAAVSPGAPAANLGWNAPSAGCSGSQSCTYSVYRGATTGSETSLATGIAGTSYADLSVVRGNPYCYQVTATNGLGESPKSSEVCVVIPTPPAPPTGLTVTTQ